MKDIKNMIMDTKAEKKNASTQKDLDAEEQSLYMHRQLALQKLKKEESASALRVQGLRTSINQLKNLRTFIQVETKELK